ncbi:TIGR03084 family metal-binding protein [Catenulispora subtropica]|uniref:TIGR03084 family metal-binding protein n=1 Tax=Catenulispora subtropica TaxID=450798 RepID=A0ABN2T2G5_9ACTN
MTAADNVFTALAEEADDFDLLLGGLDDAGWDRATPAPGWTIAHQVAHLAFVSDLAGAAAADPRAFAERTAAAKGDFQGAVDKALQAYLAGTPADIRKRWRTAHDTATAALAAVPADQTVPWLVNPLPPTVLAAAGLMELYAHGQDVRDALGVTREHDDRIGHIAFFGTRTRDFGYLAHGLTPPAEEFRFELTAPSGTLWAFGPQDAVNRVVGPAVDFCLLITRRRHYADLAITAIGTEARRWLEIAQAYRGPAGEGRRPGQFAGR